MNQKTLLIVGGSLVVAAFVLGFVPQYVKARDLTDQLGAERLQVKSEHEKSQMDELGLLCGYVYLQANLKNYGLAGQYSTKFFNRVRAMNGQAPDASRQAFLQSALAKRDSITEGLAKGDPSILGALQDLFQSTLETTQTEPK
jgi:hypothetical protein